MNAEDNKIIIDAETDSPIISWTKKLRELMESVRKRIKESPQDKEAALLEFTNQAVELESGLLTEIQFFTLEKREAEAIMESFRDISANFRQELEDII